MKPIKLTMTAFASYLNETVVDFESLGEDGIVLICGDTGSGKTTIFDAITYALFGEPSGRSRREGELRSANAGDDAPTSVELEFSVGEKRYTVRRCPSYDRHVTAKDGTVKAISVAATALLKETDSERVIAEGQTKVTNAVKGLLGMNKKQFSQTTMIAQGEFSEILNCSTKDRTDIFRDVFDTERCLKLQNRLKYEAGRLEEECNGLRDAVSRYADQIVWPEGRDPYPSTEAAKKKPRPASELLSALDELNARDSALKAEFEKAVGDLDEKIKRNNAAVAAEEAVEGMRKTLRKAVESLPGARTAEKAAKEVLDAENAKDAEREKLGKRIAHIEAELKDYPELDKKKKERDRINVEIAERTRQKEKADAEAKKCGKDIEGWQSEMAGLKDADREAGKAELEAERAKDRRDKLESLLQSLTDYKGLDDAAAEAARKYNLDYKSAYDLRKDCERSRKRFLDAQAGILAGDLRDDEPCPVCGSLTHPKKAVVSEDVPSAAQLERFEAYVKNAEDDASKSREMAGKKRGLADEKKKEIERDARALGIARAFEDLPGEAGAALSTAKTGYAAALERQRIATGNSNRKGKLDKLIADAAEKKRKADDGFTEAKNIISGLRGQMDEVEKTIKSLSEKLSYGGESEAREKKRKLETELLNLNKALETAKQGHEKAKSVRESLEKSISDNAEALKGAKPLDIEAARALGVKLDEQRRAENGKREEVTGRLTQNEKLRRLICDTSADLDKAEDRLTWVKDVSDTANGVKGSRLKFEAYVQAMYFDRVIEWANRRLLAMSDSQYELMRRDEEDDGRALNGLGLDVFDHNIAKRRSVRTLSGGESFDASMALAFGFADEVSAEAGGVRIESIFVDEGFGTLDEETLEHVMNALTGISESGVMVYVISHRQELRGYIDKQISVTKDCDGKSSVKIET